MLDRSNSEVAKNCCLKAYHSILDLLKFRDKRLKLFSGSEETDGENGEEDRGDDWKDMSNDYGEEN